MLLKREMEMLKREDRQSVVDRISRANDYKKAKIQEKIEFDN